MNKTVFQNTLAAAVGVALFGVGVSAMATVDLNTNIGALTYASELTGPTQAITNGSSNLDLSVKIGFGVSQGQTLFIRVNLTGANFSGALDASKLTIVDGATVIADNTNTIGSVALVQGGGSTGTSVIYQITAINAATQNAAVLLKLNGVTIPNTSSAATATYALYATGADAVGQVNKLASTTAADIAKFGKALVFTPVVGSRTATVTTMYKQFSGTGLAAVALGQITYGVNGYLDPASASSSPATLAQLVTGGNAVLGGNFSAFAQTGGMFISTASGSCSGSFVAGVVATDKLSASFALGNAIPATGTITRDVCVMPDGTNAIPAQEVTSRFDVAAASGTSTANVAAAAQGTILRDGTVLKVPFMFGGYASQATYVNLANMGSTAAGYTTRCFSPTGPVTSTGAQKAGTIAAGASLKVYMSGLGCGATANAVEFTLAVPEGNVVGTLVRLNTTTGDSGYSDLTGNK